MARLPAREGRMVEIAGCGIALPAREVTNVDLAQSMTTNPEFILQRTGVRTRRFVSEGENNATLITAAVDEALDQAGMEPEAVDLMIVSTLSPDFHDPSQACLVHGMIPGMRNIPVLDIRAQCSGFLYGLYLARSVLLAQSCKAVLLVCSEVLSRRVWGDLGDRNIAVLVGDGAGAAVITMRGSNGNAGLLDVRLGADGSHHSALRTARPGVASGRFVNDEDGKAAFQFKMEGARVWQHAIDTMSAAIEECLRENRIGLDQIDSIVCHQPNPVMVRALADRFAEHRHKFIIEGDRLGNMASASLAVGWANHSRNAARGSMSMMVAYGAGATWGTALYRH